MGYGKQHQTGHGIHMRLRARAFIMGKAWKESESDGAKVEILRSGQKVERLSLRSQWNRPRPTEYHTDEEMSVAELADPEQTVCFVSADIGMGSDLLTMKVVKRLEEILPEQRNSGKPLCRLENLSIR